MSEIINNEINDEELSAVSGGMNQGESKYYTTCPSCRKKTFDTRTRSCDCGYCDNEKASTNLI